MKHFKPAGFQTEQLRRYEEMGLGVFAHFNMQQFIYTENEFVNENDPKYWTPENLDVEQWFRCWSSAGVRYAVLCVRHTSDFCLWPTRTTPYHVMNSPVPVDVVGDFVKYARKYNIEPCFYYCLWGGEYNPQKDAEKTLFAQLDELCTQYGDIFLFWLDMANWRPENVTVQQLYDFVKERQPKTLVHFNQHIQDGTKIIYFPTDALNGEERIPPEEGHQKIRRVEGEDYYLPFEFEVCLQHVDEDVGKGYMRGTRWFTYSGGRPGMPVSTPIPPEVLHPYIRQALRRGASNILVSTAADHTGQVRAQDIEALRGIRAVIDEERSAGKNEAR